MKDIVSQKCLSTLYRGLSERNLPPIRETGFSVYSQHDEDGILLFLTSIVQLHFYVSIEICAGNGMECNTSNLLINHNWSGLLIDGDLANVDQGEAFFANHPATALCPPQFKYAWVTAENVNDLVKEHENAELLSLDLDGMDYWVWKALKIKPAIVVCEIHNPIPPELALTVPYDPDFRFKDPDYRGASLRAMCKLAEEKGYTFVGMNRYGFNAFFVDFMRMTRWLPKPTIEQALSDPYSIAARRDRWPKVKHMNWQEV